MARQIISSRNEPARLNPRQQAFSSGLDMIQQGIGGLGKSMAMQEQMEKTDRQRAFEEYNQLAQQGVIDPQEMPIEGYMQARQGGSDLSGELAQRQAEIGAQQRERAAQDAELQREMQRQNVAYKQGQLGLQRRKMRLAEQEASLPFEQTREAQKLKYATSLQGQKPAKDVERKSLGFAKRAIQAEEALSKLPTDVGTDWTYSVTGSDFYPEALKSEKQKLFEQAKSNFISSVLRKESGAAISDQEYERENAKYFPQPGDTPAVIAQKSAARAQAVRNLQSEAGPAFQGQAFAGIENRYNESPSSGFGMSEAIADEPLYTPEVLGGMSIDEKRARAIEKMKRMKGL